MRSSSRRTLDLENGARPAAPGAVSLSLPQLATASVVTAETGSRRPGLGACDEATELEVKTLNAAGTLIDAHFSLAVH